MVTEPIARVETMPLALIVAIAVSDELHVTSGVISNVELLDKPASAENCWVVPAATAGFNGETAIEDTVATVSVVEPEIPLKAASMVVCPAVRAVEIPLLLMVATLVADELHAAGMVKSCSVPFVSTPVALNCCEVSTMLVEVSGDTVIETSGEDVNAVDPEMFPEVAVMVVDPAVSAEATPFGPAALNETTALFEELHETDVVKS